MKNKIITILLSAFLVTMMIGCTDDDETCTVVENVNCLAGNVQACCTSSDCKYIYDGKNYPCNGTDCEAAAQVVANLCINGSTASIESNSTSIRKQLLLEVSKGLLLEKEIDRLSID